MHIQQWQRVPCSLKLNKNQNRYIDRCKKAKHNKKIIKLITLGLKPDQKIELSLNVLQRDTA